MIRTYSGLLALLCSASVQGVTFEQQYQVNYFSLNSLDAQNNTNFSHAVSSRANWLWRLNDSQFTVHYQLSLYDQPNNLLPTDAANPFRISDLAPEVSSNRLYQNLDRLLFTHRFEYADLYLGRQALSLGVARFSSVVDVFFPHFIGALQTDYRQGVDAAKIEMNLPFDERGLSLFDSAWLGKNRWYGRGRTNIMNTDVHGTFVDLDEHRLASVSLDGSTGEFGWWFETTQVTLELQNIQDIQTFHIGGDFSLADFLYQLEIFHRTGKLDSDAQTTLNEFSALPYGDENYGFLSATYLAGSRSQFSAQLIHNFDHSSEQFAFIYSLNFNDHWDMNIQVNTNDEWYRSDNTEFQKLGHLISINIQGVY